MRRRPTFVRSPPELRPQPPTPVAIESYSTAAVRGSVAVVGGAWLRTETVQPCSLRDRDPHAMAEDLSYCEFDLTVG